MREGGKKKKEEGKKVLLLLRNHAAQQEVRSQRRHAGLALLARTAPRNKQRCQWQHKHNRRVTNAALWVRLCSRGKGVRAANNRPHATERECSTATLWGERGRKRLPSHRRDCLTLGAPALNSVWKHLRWLIPRCSFTQRQYDFVGVNGIVHLETVKRNVVSDDLGALALVSWLPTYATKSTRDHCVGPLSSALLDIP